MKDAAYQKFLEKYPVFAETHTLDELRATEYFRLDEQDHIYLDYTGGSLYSASQVRNHGDLLLKNVFGNPHSTNPTSLAATELVEKTRQHVLDFFNASPEEYVVIFTPNASGALKLVGESYPFQTGDYYLLTVDNHNSVLGIREFDRGRGAHTAYIPIKAPEMEANEDKANELLELADPEGNNLMAYPAQSNFSGVQYPLNWIEKAQVKGWDVLLDAAAFVPTNQLDLSQYHPDFVPISFYKMFGYPTGIGALLIRKDALAKLKRPWFAGGTIVAASVRTEQYFLAQGAEGFEDGTLNYLMLPAIDIGLSHLESIRMEIIHSRVECLVGWLIDELTTLKHSNGQPSVSLYGPRDTKKRGATIAFNLFDREGKEIDYMRVEQEANKKNISLRTGCFCNPGTGEVIFGLSKDEITTCFTHASTYSSTADFRHCFEEKRVGAIRVSLGLVSNFNDVYYFVEFIKNFLK